MANAMRVSNYQRPVDLLEIAKRTTQTSSTSGSGKPAFKEMFSEELASARSIQFSKHASQRLFSRNIELSSEKVGQIADAVDKAARKGSKETLILTDDSALVVSVKDRTVVTAFDRSQLKDGVVTSIDSAVIL